MDNVKIHEPLGNSDHNQIHVDINVKTESKKIFKVKVRSYIARYPVHRTAQSALHFTPWQTCSFQGHLNFFGKISATLQLLSVLPGTHLYS